MVGVSVDVGVLVGVAVGGTAEGVKVAVAVGVILGVNVAVAVGVGVGALNAWHDALIRTSKSKNRRIKTLNHWLAVMQPVLNKIERTSINRQGYHDLNRRTMRNAYGWRLTTGAGSFGLSGMLVNRGGGGSVEGAAVAAVGTADGSV